MRDKPRSLLGRLPQCRRAFPHNDTERGQPPALRIRGSPAAGRVP